jgi:gamma-glutamyl-gamma-aminobutyrate hydrolase PuuD
MIRNKPLIGILPTPYIKDAATKKILIPNELFLTEDIINFLEQQHIDYIIIPYTINKYDLKKLLPNLDGLLFPPHHHGDFYNNKYVRQHFSTQKYIVKEVKLLAHANILIPILSICHGHQTMILIENKYNLTNKNIKNTFTDVKVKFEGIKTIPKFKNTKLGNLFKTNFNKTKKLYHNHSMAVDVKNNIKNYEVIATNSDINNKEYVDIIKHKKYPFFGFQGHPEVENTKLFAPYISYVNACFNKKSNQKIINEQLYNKLNLLKLNARIISCKKYTLEETMNIKCGIFYKF